MLPKDKNSREKTALGRCGVADTVAAKKMKRRQGHRMVVTIARLVLAIGILLILPVMATAQSVADFYKGKNVDLYIGYSVGGAYDLYARMLARHMGKHIPGNPNVIPKNMEGAG